MQNTNTNTSSSLNKSVSKHPDYDFVSELIFKINTVPEFFKTLTLEELEKTLVRLGEDVSQFSKYNDNPTIKRMIMSMHIKKVLNISAKDGLNIEPIKHKLLNGFSDYLTSQDELCQDNINMLEILPKLLKLQNDKGRVYGRSYAKHGDVSIFLNCERKFDRISNIMDKAMKDGMKTLFSEDSSTPTETFLDTVVDLALYSLMWAAYIKEQHPQEYDQFLQANKL